MKYWINQEPGNDKLIIWDGNKLYKANPKEHKLRDMEYLLKKGEIPEGLFSIYKMHIKRVEMDESKNYLCVYFGGESYEHLRVTNFEIKKEIFDELSKTENTVETVKELTISEKTRIQKRALIVLTVLFLIGLIFSLMIETVGLPEGRYPVILLFLGGLGSKNVILFYLIITLIIGVKIYFVSKTSKIIHTLQFK